MIGLQHNPTHDPRLDARIDREHAAEAANMAAQESVSEYLETYNVEELLFLLGEKGLAERFAQLVRLCAYPEPGEDYTPAGLAQEIVDELVEAERGRAA